MHIYTGPPPKRDARSYAMLCHLLAIVSGFIAPLIIWLLKRKSSKFVDDQGKEALNFWICISAIFLVCVAFAEICAIALAAVAVWLAGTAFSVYAAVRASEGVAFRYPWTLRLIK